MTRDGFALITKDFQGSTVRAVDHPQAGHLLMAADVLRAAGYNLTKASISGILRTIGLPKCYEVKLSKEALLFPTGLKDTRTFNSGAKFLTEAGVNYVLMRSTKPQAREFQKWLAEDVTPAIKNTGGYLLNESFRDTAKADIRETIPLPVEMGGAYAALIAEKEARIAAEMDALKAHPSDPSGWLGSKCSSAKNLRGHLDGIERAYPPCPGLAVTRTVPRATSRTV